MTYYIFYFYLSCYLFLEALRIANYDLKRKPNNNNFYTYYSYYAMMCNGSNFNRGKHIFFWFYLRLLFIPVLLILELYNWFKVK